MKKQQEILLTQEGFKELKKEHQELVKVKRPKTVERLKDAREMGDLSENTAYSTAKQDLSFIDQRISELEEILKKAKVVKTPNKGEKKVGIGSKVTLKDGKEKTVFTIVGDWEADPLKKRISFSSPIGKALMGKKKSAKVEVDVPAGKINYQILAIE
ncbi:transcription elongation factor GreA [Candidatus Microgenomates bacterium]|nr:transcription elongation factor GreA [Candidatus Microgenomates bacterium]